MALSRRLHFLFFFNKFRGLERLPIESNLGNADGGEILPVSTQLLVLLLFLVVEDQDFLAASLFNHLAAYERARTRRQNAAHLGGNRQHVAELDLAVLV